MNRFYSLHPIVAMLAVTGLMTVTPRASAEERPYVLRGTAQFVNANDFVGSGHATHLGSYTEVGSAQFSPTANPAVFQIDAWAILTAANGDQLYEVITGSLNGATGAITATVTYVGGTGRFTDASGTATLSGQLLGGGAVSVTVEGTIDY